MGTLNYLSDMFPLHCNKMHFVISQRLMPFFSNQKRKGSFHHSSFLAGGATLAAGRLMAEDGKLMV